jgi:hypothetical protein
MQRSPQVGDRLRAFPTCLDCGREFDVSGPTTLVCVRAQNYRHSTGAGVRSGDRDPPHRGCLSWTISCFGKPSRVDPPAARTIAPIRRCELALVRCCPTPLRTRGGACSGARRSRRWLPPLPLVTAEICEIIESAIASGPSRAKQRLRRVVHPGQGVEHLRRRMLVATLFEAQVINRAGASERRKLLTTESRNASPAAFGQPNVLRPHQGSSRAKVFTQNGSRPHGSRMGPVPEDRQLPASSLALIEGDERRAAMVGCIAVDSAVD